MTKKLREHMLNMIQSEGDFSYEELEELEILAWSEIMDRQRIDKYENKIESAMLDADLRDEAAWGGVYLK